MTGRAYRNRRKNHRKQQKKLAAAEEKRLNDFKWLKTPIIQ